VNIHAVMAYGSLREVAEILNSDDPPDDPALLRMALTNVVNRCEQMEKDIRTLLDPTGY
jgi:hypothetical protein